MGSAVASFMAMVRTFQVAPGPLLSRGHFMSDRCTAPTTFRWAVRILATLLTAFLLAALGSWRVARDA